MRELSAREIEHVSGGWGVPGAGIGALAGATYYLGRASTSGIFDAGGLTRAIAYGAVTGAVAGPLGIIRSYFLPRVTFGIGVARGLQIRSYRLRGGGGSKKRSKKDVKFV